MKITLKEMFDADLLENMLNDLYKIVKVPISLVDINGEVIVQAGWTSLCTNLYSKCEGPLKQCMEVCIKNDKMTSPSNQLLSCHNSLKIYRTPIYMKGTVVANVFFSQFLTMKPQEESIVNEADYSLDAYRNTYQDIPVIEENHMEQVILFIDSFANMINDLIKKNITIHRKQLMDTVITMGSMLEKKDLYTAGHQKNVAYLAYKIALEIGLDINRKEGVYIAGLLHDIGKIGIPVEILTKPDKLSTSEFEIIKNHVPIAYDILRVIEFPWPIATIVLQHHEKINGKGYPNGLSGDEISLEAKILSVADVVEAITAHRPYRPSLGLTYALDEIKQFSGIYYEPEIVEACIRVCSKNNWNTMINAATTNSFSSIFDIKD